MPIARSAAAAVAHDSWQGCRNVMVWIDSRTNSNDVASHRMSSRPSVSRNSTTRARKLLAIFGLAFLSLATGCQAWSPGAQIKQCQLESDRLLAEFRAQKKRADELEGRYQESQTRLAEAEKLLARLQNGNGRSGGVLADRSAIPSRNSNSAAGNAAGTGAQDNRFNSAGADLGRSTGNSDRNIQWRPQGTPIR